MDINVIKECTDLSLVGSITFPEVVMRLAQTGVERYIADLSGRLKLSYGVHGETHTCALAFDGPEIAATLDAAAIKSAITDSQQQKIDYQSFLRRVMVAGCCHYEVFITGRKAIYTGRDGSQHIELFPTAK